MVCYVMCMDSVQQNIRRGHKRFAQHVIPVLANNGWPAPVKWHDMAGSDLDTKHGIDYMVGQTPVAARIWDGTPKQHFAIRWYNTMHPDRRFELTKLLTNWANGDKMPQYTIEAHTHNGKTHVAVCKTLDLVTIIADNHPNLPQFLVNNKRGDWAVFVRVAFDLFPPDSLRLFIG